MGRRGLLGRLAPRVNKGSLALWDQKVKPGQLGHKAIPALLDPLVRAFHPVAPRVNGSQKRPIPIMITHGLIRHLWK